MSLESSASKRRQVLVVEAPISYSSAQLGRAPRPFEFKTKQNINDVQKDAKSIDFQKVWSSVTDYGASNFIGRKKRTHGEATIIALGGNAPKPIKTPYPRLQKILKKRKEREAKQLLFEKESGVVSGVAISMKMTGKSKRKIYRNFNSNKSNTGRPKNVDFGPAPGNGYVNSTGVMKIRDISDSNRNKKTSKSR